MSSDKKPRGLSWRSGSRKKEETEASAPSPQPAKPANVPSSSPQTTNKEGGGLSVYELAMLTMAGVDVDHLEELQNWNCAVCTMINPIANSLCSACEQPRSQGSNIPQFSAQDPSHESKRDPFGGFVVVSPGTVWICSKCTLENRGVISTRLLPFTNT